MVAEGRFREDLFYRINVIPIAPAAAARARARTSRCSPSTSWRSSPSRWRRPIDRHLAARRWSCCSGYDWPGNIRELENVIERAVALERTPSILPESLPDVSPRRRVPAVRRRRRSGPARTPCPTAGFDLEAHVQDLEREYIAEALKRAGGVQVKAAELLGMSFRSFRYYVKKYNLK